MEILGLSSIVENTLERYVKRMHLTLCSFSISYKYNLQTIYLILFSYSSATLIYERNAYNSSVFYKMQGFFEKRWI